MGSDRRYRRGTMLLYGGLTLALLSIVGFAACGYVGAREQVFGGWIVLLFLGAVAALVAAGFGMTQRRRAVREAQENDASS